MITLTLKSETFAGFKIQRKSVFYFVTDFASVILSSVCTGLLRRPQAKGVISAILYALTSFETLIQGKAVKLYTDIKNASAICQSGGSTSLRLQQQALEIFPFCAVNNVSVEIDRVPRSLNEYADSLSKIIDFDD